MKTLSLERMEGIEGGKAYCSTLAMITQNNTISGGSIDGAISGFYAGSCDRDGYAFQIIHSTTGDYILVYKVETT